MRALGAFTAIASTLQWLFHIASSWTFIEYFGQVTEPWRIVAHVNFTYKKQKRMIAQKYKLIWIELNFVEIICDHFL